MVLAERHIHQLRLRGSSAAAINRGAILLEDALRAASLPAVPGRVLLIRSLPLGAIDLHSNSTRLALLVEQRLRDVTRNAVHITAPDASRANAVYYHDQPEALLLLAQRIATGQPVSEWFWPRILPGWNPNEPKSRTLPHMFEAVIGQLPQASADQRAAVLYWLDLLRNHNLLNSVLRALSPADGAQLLRLFQWEMPLPVDSHLSDSADSTHLPRRLADWQPVLHDWVQVWGPTDARLTWLAFVAIEPALPALPPVLLALRVQQVIHRAQLPITPEAESRSRPTDAAYAQRAESESVRGDVILPGTAYATALGGLFYCIRILEYLGIRAALESQPEWAEQQLVGHIFRAIAARNSLTMSDPALTILTDDLGALPFATQAYTVPASWEEIAVEPAQMITNSDWSALLDADGLPFAVWSGATPSELSGIPTMYDETFSPPTLPAAWASAIERWCLRYLDRPLLALIERSAQVVATRTHLDIVFTHQQVDVEVRRAGLDFDPGWIPWLGKVMKFYYENGR